MSYPDIYPDNLEFAKAALAGLGVAFEREVIIRTRLGKLLARSLELNDRATQSDRVLRAESEAIRNDYEQLCASARLVGRREEAPR